jgi:4-azaleucine resistance transporter AzlC
MSVLRNAPVRDIAAIAVAAGFVGLSYGAIATASGLPAWAVVAMSVVVFAGGSQFLAVGTLAAGSPIAAILGGLLLNARHLPFGLAVADVLDGGWGRRLVGTHLMVDESVAFAMAASDPARRRASYWLAGAGIFVLWNLGTVAGVEIGAAVGDPARYGLDAAFPAALLALVMPRFSDPAARRVALLGATVAVAAPVLLALIGLVAAGRNPSTVAS